MKYLNFLGTYRKMKRLNQWQFGEMLSVSQSKISAWETGRELPTIDEREKISSVLGQPIQKIWPDEEEEKLRQTGDIW